MQGLFCVTYGTPSFSSAPMTARLVNLDIEPSFSFLTKLPGIQILILLDSCKGLVLFGHRQEQYSGTFSLGYIVCNPTTRQWEAMPACTSAAPLTYTYLAFDPAVSSHFHLVLFQVEDITGQLVSVHAYSSECHTWVMRGTGSFLILVNPNAACTT
ncbi:hypothetical protein GQ55_2G054700 [Panicum hallii var. hallii]|uniref:F-box associated beta-propeller type 3 domain-containing protein n=1 Tax=Panicum hallii var. hallii TaxID=1504633 RepID=A0A2T7ELU1_9POAL|nr:hypothetical protein GQ55_2G054700 [Panicum hallii var. hallii]